jgi:glucokinase
VILSPPNLSGWDEVEIVRMLSERYGGAVCLQNDANACALAEWRYGAGKGCENMIFLTFGSGLGAGLILGGRLYEGANGMAGEVGHIRLSDFGPVGYGKRGSFEGFCSGNGIAALGRMLAEESLQLGKSVSYCDGGADLTAVTAKRIAECARAGHADALRVYEICGERLGTGLSILIDVLNPERIVIGSVFQRSGELLIPSMRRALEREALGIALSACEILPAALKENIGDYAALSCAAMAKE